MKLPRLKKEGGRQAKGRKKGRKKLGRRILQGTLPLLYSLQEDRNEDSLPAFNNGTQGQAPFCKWKWKKHLTRIVLVP